MEKTEITLKEFIEMKKYRLIEIASDTNLSMSLISKVSNGKEKMTENTKYILEKTYPEYSFIQIKSWKDIKIESLKARCQELEQENAELRQKKENKQRLMKCLKYVQKIIEELEKN